MSEFFSRSFPAKAISARIDTLRSRGRIGLLAALGAPEATPSPALPDLQGEALARHHLALALDACHEQGRSKPDAFRALRLLVNKLEQGRVPALPKISVPAGLLEEAPTRRRSRLLSRAFLGAHALGDWRKGSPESPAEMR